MLFPWQKKPKWTLPEQSPVPHHLLPPMTRDPLGSQWSKRADGSVVRNPDGSARWGQTESLRPGDVPVWFGDNQFSQQSPITETKAPSGGNVFANLLGRPETDTDFWDSLKEQLGEAGADYDAADQPFKSLTATNVGTGRPQAVKMPSMLTTRGIPTGGSYNPYLGDPAKRKRPR